MDFELPEGVKEENLIPDKYRRAGHWYDTASGEVIACPIDWTPKVSKSKKPASAKVEEPVAEEPVGEAA